MQKNTQGFSIIIGIGLIIIMSLVAYLILSYMHSFTQIVSGVQNSAVAYYNAYVGVEESLYHIKQRKEKLTKEYEDLSPLPPSPLPLPPSEVPPVTFSTTSSADTIPRIGFGQSDFDKNWNIVSQLHPLQIEVGGKSYHELPAGKLPDNFIDNIKILFRAPKLGDNKTFQVCGPLKNEGWNCGALTSPDELPILMWTLVAGDNSLTSISDGPEKSYIMTNKINDSDQEIIAWTTNIKGEVLDTEDSEIPSTDPHVSFTEFHDKKCKTNDQKCSLRIGVINNLYDNNPGKKVTFPYLEYKIEMGTGKVLPDQYTHIRSVGSAGEFRRQIDLFIPQQTVPQAFDFTVIQ